MKIRKALSLLLALVFAVSLIPAALAAETVDIGDETMAIVDQYAQIPLNVDLSQFKDNGQASTVRGIQRDPDSDRVPGMDCGWDSASQRVVFSGTPTTPGVYEPVIFLTLSNGTTIHYYLTLTVVRQPVTINQSIDLVVDQQSKAVPLDVGGKTGEIYSVKSISTSSGFSGQLMPGTDTSGLPVLDATAYKTGEFLALFQVIYKNGDQVMINATLHVKEPGAAHTVTAENCYIITGKGEGDYATTITAKKGDVVTVAFTIVDTNHKPDMGRRFDHWEVTPSSVTIKDDGTFIMPDQDVKIVGVAQKLTKITVQGGTTAEDQAFPNETYTITADDPPAGQVFDHWEVVSGGVTVKDPTSPNTSFVVGDKDVVIKAVFKAADSLSITSVTITGATLPVAGATPTTAGLKVETPHVTAYNIYWTKNGGDMGTTPFEAGWNYYLAVSLHPEDGYSFSDDLQVTVNGVAPTAENSVRHTATPSDWLALVGFAVPEDGEKTNPFVDIAKTDLWYDAVLWAYYAKPQVTNGVDATHFGPEKTVTRGQCATFLWRAMGCPEPTDTKNPFVDVSADQYYYKPILWAVEKGITKGTDATHFSPNSTLSTAHIITFLYRAKNPGNDGWYQDAATWAEKGYGTGKPFGVSTPVNPATDCPRGYVVMFLEKVK